MLQHFSHRHTGLLRLSSTPPAFKGLDVGPSGQVMGKAVRVVTGRFCILLAGWGLVTDWVQEGGLYSVGGTVRGLVDTIGDHPNDGRAGC